MKTLIYGISCLCLFSLNNLSGQSRKWQFRPIAGISANSVYSPNAWTYKFSPYLLGLEVATLLKNGWSLVNDVYYIRKGTHSKKNSGDREQDYQFDFIIISPQLAYELGERSGLEYLFGLYTGIKLDAKARFYPDETFSDYDPEGQNEIDFGFNTSIRKYFEIGNVDLSIEPRFQLGLVTYSFTKQISFQLISTLSF